MKLYDKFVKWPMAVRENVRNLARQCHVLCAVDDELVDEALARLLDAARRAAVVPLGEEELERVARRRVAEAHVLLVDAHVLRVTVEPVHAHLQ